jgi:PUA-like domain
VVLARLRVFSINRTTFRAFLLVSVACAASELLCVDSVVDTLRLADGTLFPIPINLDVSEEDIEYLGIVSGARITLRDGRDDVALAILTGTVSETQDLPNNSYLFVLR